MPAPGTTVSGSSIAAFRVATGALGAVACLRFLLMGWVGELWVRPAHHFHWPGLWWVRPLPAGWMEVFVAGVGLCWLGLAVSAALEVKAMRALATGATLGFAYLGTIDVATYLNHYVLLVIAGGLCAVLPSGPVVPRWAVWAVRYVVGTTYVWAAIAKVDPDWLSGATVRPWLAANVGLPVIGSWFRHAGTSTAVSWAGLAFDATVVPLLAWRGSRPFAYALVLAFHVATAVLFPIGMFPWIMIALTPVLFEPRWAQRWLPLRHRSRVPLLRAPHHAEAAIRWAVAAAVVGLSLLPLRSVVADTWWSEQGGRLSWRVMAVDKVGLADLWVVPDDRSPPHRVRPTEDLSPLQAQQVSWQPDLLLQWAHLVADRERSQLGVDVHVYADVWVSVNGRPAMRLVDPDVDLAKKTWSFGRPTWVLDAPKRSFRS